MDESNNISLFICFKILTDKFPKASIVGPKSLSETERWINEYSQTATTASPETIIETNF